MVLEHLVAELEFHLRAVFVVEGRFDFALIARVEALHLDLLGEIDTRDRHALVDSFLGAPVDGQL